MAVPKARGHGAARATATAGTAGIEVSEIEHDEAYVEGGLNSDADLRDPLARSYVAPSFIACDTALTLPILGDLAP